MKSIYLSRYKIFFFLLPVFFGCRKFVTVPSPVTSINGGNVYTADQTATAVLTGIYAQLSNSGGISSLGADATSVFAGLSADEFSFYGGASVNFLQEYQYYTNSLISNTPGSDGQWGATYPLIYTVNAAIAGLNASTTLTSAVKQQLLGEAYFMRAFFYFYLVNEYGAVPLVLTTTYTTNALLPRASKALVWQQVIADLKVAEAQLSSNFLDVTLLASSPERVRPSKWAAAALLARAYLYTQDYPDAEKESTELISNTSLFSLSPVNTAFLRAGLGNNEAIWQWQPVNSMQNTTDAQVFILPSSGPDNVNYPIYLNPGLVSSFESGDLRKTNWTGNVTVGGTTYYYPYKYKINDDTTVVNEYYMVFRLGEQYLIRAEARAEQTETPGSLADLDAIRSRAGLPAYGGATDQASLLAAIWQERRVELFSEWGHRWFDLKRTGTVNAVMGVVTPEKGGTWNPDWQYYPVPLQELKLNPELTQNAGY